MTDYLYWNRTRGVFAGGRSDNHDKAVERLGHEMFDETMYYRKSFIKKEVLRSPIIPVRTKTPQEIIDEHGELPSPIDIRAISGATDEFNVSVAPGLYQWSKALSRSWNPEHWILYTSGQTAESITSWMHNQCMRLDTTLEDCVKILSDESRQDAHVSVQALRWEHKLMLLQGVDPEIIYHLRQSINPKGFTQNGLFYRRKGTRQTGDPHTGSGNTNMNAIKLLWTLIGIFRKEGIEVDLNNPPFAICVQGDDSFVLVHPKYLYMFKEIDFKEASKRLGFKIKFCLITQELSECDYCSRIFYPVTDTESGWMLGPKIGKVLHKIGFSSKPVHDQYRHNAGVISSLKYDCSYIPFMHEWYDKMKDLTKEHTPYKRKFDHGIHAAKYHQVDGERLWDMMWKRYDLTELDHVDFVKELEQVDSLPYRLNNDVIDRMLKVDY
jgi:hypothetical protein